MFKMYATFFVTILLTLNSGSGALMDDLNEITDFQHENSSLQQSVSNQRPVDCSDIYENGFDKSGVYEIYLNNRNIARSSFNVYCDMETSGGGWTVIQRRGDFKRPVDYFYKTWNQYKNGFGSLKRDFWLGNDYIHALTNQKKYSVRFDLRYEKETAYAVYESFWIDNEEYKYKLHLSDYSGTAGDSMSYNNNNTFSTKDQPGTNNCPAMRKGGWWYDYCTFANLNGLYIKGIYKEEKKEGIVWDAWKSFKVSLSDVEIKIRPHDF